jgi:hypothetical protein
MQILPVYVTQIMVYVTFLEGSEIFLGANRCLPEKNLKKAADGEMCMGVQLLSILFGITARQFCIQFKGGGSMPPPSSHLCKMKRQQNRTLGAILLGSSKACKSRARWDQFC